MKVILKQDIEKLGSFGEKVDVSGGYARNFLFPRDLAWPADSKYEKQISELSRKIEEKSKKQKEAALEIAGKIEETSLTIEMEAGEDDKLFGSVTSMDVAGKLGEAGFDLDKKDIKLDQPIKKLGVYKVAVKLHPEVEAYCKLWVVKK